MSTLDEISEDIQLSMLGMRPKDVRLLRELKSGERILLPTSIEHAKAMLLVAEAYLKHNQGVEND